MKKKSERKKINFGLISLILLGTFILSVFLTSFIETKFQIKQIETESNIYVSDEGSFLKTFYLMKRGNNFYDAFKTARENLAFGSNIQRDIFTWRMPTTFYIWFLFAKDGGQILNLFIFLGLLSLFSVFLILKKITTAKLAILGILLLLPYFYDTFAYKTAFLFTEWWGFIFFIIGLATYIYKFKKTAIICFTLAITSRELFIVPIGSFVILSFFKKEDWKLFLLPIVLGLIVYMIHASIVRNIIGDTTNLRFLTRFHTYNFLNLQRMISFSMKGYVLWGLKTHYLILILGLSGLLLKYLQTKIKEVVYLLITILSFLIFLPLVSVWENDYWGIMFVPLIIISVPFLLKT